MNLNQLEYFVSVAEMLNFTRAAERCFISQTAMSQQIRALEETVGVPLLNRNRHKVELTAAGKVYLNEARAILERSGEAVRLARIAAEGLDGTLSIGYIRGYGQRDFAQHLRSFRNQNPRVNVSLVRDNTSILMDHLETGTCDVIFTLSPHSWNKYPQMNHLKIRSYPLMAVLPPDHWLSNRSVVRYQDLAEEHFIIMQPSGRPTEEMEESLLIYEKGGFMPDIAALQQDPEEILLSVSVGIGISLLPEYMLRQHADSQEFCVRPLLNSDDSRELLDLELIWSRNNTNPSIDRLIQTLTQ